MLRPTREEELMPWLVGESAPMRELRELILRIAPAPMPVWVEGETGAGKEQVALALHAASGRRGAFVPINVCSISDTMFEDALFGHARGAFTGAVGESLGYLGEANAGTLFLDEISGLSVAAQAKLLRAIETRRYRQVGGRADRSSDFRVIVASNEPFDRLLREGRFRHDLGYRLRGAAFRVPPLRARLQDLPALVAHFAGCGDDAGALPIGEGALTWLSEQRWSGNVRELRQLVLCAQTLSHGKGIREADLRAARAMLCCDDRAIAGLDGALEPQRKELLALLDHCRWNTGAVAAALEIDRTTVYRRMRRLQIEAPSGNRKGRIPTWAPIGRQLGAHGA